MRGMRVGRWYAVCSTSILALCLGCNIHVVQSREEFVSAVRQGRGPTEVCELTVDKPMRRIVALLRDRSDACVAVTVRRSGVAGGTPYASANRYNPTLKIHGKRAQYTVQIDQSPRPVGPDKYPDGGLYLVAADLEAHKPGHTRVAIYRPTMGHGELMEALEQWLRGKPTECPDLE